MVNWKEKEKTEDKVEDVMNSNNATGFVSISLAPVAAVSALTAKLESCSSRYAWASSVLWNRVQWKEVWILLWTLSKRGIESVKTAITKMFCLHTVARCRTENNIITVNINR
jgi:hypothetical protein